MKKVYLILGSFSVLIIVVFVFFLLRLRQVENLPITVEPVASELSSDSEGPTIIDDVVDDSPCHTTGCSGQFCQPTNDLQIEVVTTCEYKPEYSCLVYTTCELQADGQCGFTENDAYLDCLKKYSTDSQKDTNYVLIK